VGGAIEVQGRTSVGGGAGEVGEAFRAPEMKGAGGGARTGGTFTAPGMKGAENGANGGAGRTLFSRFFHSCVALGHERPERKVGVGVHFSPSRVIS